MKTNHNMNKTCNNTRKGWAKSYKTALLDMAAMTVQPSIVPFLGK